MKQILDVGQCSADHSAIKHLVSSLGASAIQTHSAEDTLKVLEGTLISLILINRILDRSGVEGIALLKQLKSDSKYSNIPVMIVSNYEDTQKEALEAGAVPGFGKSAIRKSSTRELIAQYLK